MKFQTALIKLHEMTFKAVFLSKTYRITKAMDDIIKSIAVKEGESATTVIQAAVLMLQDTYQNPMTPDDIKSE